MPRRRKVIRIAALLVALFIIVVSMGGIISPDSLMTLRRMYYATPGRFYTAGAVRVAMGLVLILAASSSRWPRTLRALGAVMCMQGLAATTLFGLERARSILEWEAMHMALMRAGAVLALVTSVLVAFAVIKWPSEWPRKVAH